MRLGCGATQDWCDHGRPWGACPNCDWNEESGEDWLEWLDRRYRTEAEREAMRGEGDGKVEGF